MVRNFRSTLDKTSFDNACFVQALSGRIRSFNARFSACLIIACITILICYGRIEMWIPALIGLATVACYIWEVRYGFALVRRAKSVRPVDIERYQYIMSAAVSLSVSMAPILWFYGGVEGKIWASFFVVGTIVQIVVTMHSCRFLLFPAMLPVTFMLLFMTGYDAAISFGQDNFAAAMAVFLGAVLLVRFLFLNQEALFQIARTQIETRHRLQKERQAAQSAHDSKAEFLAVTSHELRTPMNAMLGSIELLRRTRLTGEQRKILSMLSEGGDVLMSLLNDILDMSKIESRKLEIESIPVDLHHLVHGLIDMWGARASDKNLALTLDIHESFPVGASIDPTRLRQILFNILSNAVKFTESGGVTVTVKTRLDDERQRILSFEVKDTGCGMSPETLARLFRPFQQGDTSVARKYGGTGLGLSISKALAELMGGRICATSEEGVGSTFTLEVPYVAATIAPANRQMSDAKSDPSGKPLRILIAEDHPANRRILAALLQPFGYTLSMARNGVEAVELLAKEDFDIILMDMQMPEMDGCEATRQIRKMGPKGAHVPIVALTANASQTDRNACLAAGMDDFIAKPIDPRELHAAMLRAVHLSDSMDVDESPSISVA